MQTIKLGLFGLALGHPLGFADYLATRGFVPTFLVIDETQAEEVTRRDTLLAKWPDLTVVPDAEAMLAGGVGAVFCASQTNRHVEDCRPFITNRIPLFIDKPLATDYAQARQILNLVEEYDAPMMSCSVRRFSENYNALFEQISAGRVGTVLFAECYEPHGTTPGYWQDRKETSGGLVVNYGVHVVDPIVRALGTEVRRVQCYAAKNVLPDVDSEDTAVMLLQYANGAIAIGKVSGAYHYGQGKPVPTVGHFSVHGSDAALETFFDETDVKVYRGGNFGVSPAYYTKAGDHATLDAFAEMARTGTRPIPLADMDAVMRILDAARRSIDSGAEVTLA
jgi:predicted dehydrogenase